MTRPLRSYALATVGELGVETNLAEDVVFNQGNIVRRQSRAQPHQLTFVACGMQLPKGLLKLEITMQTWTGIRDHGSLELRG